MSRRAFVFIFLVVAAIQQVGLGQVRINEIMAAPSERVFKWNEGAYPTIGIAQNAWWDREFDDTYWLSGFAPIGFGWDEIQTNLSIESERPSFYARLAFDASAAQAASGSKLLLDLVYDDGIIVYLNGVEVVRRNMGPTGLPVYHDQGAYNQHETLAPESIDLGAASDLLVEGLNLIAIHVLNWWDINNTLALDAKLYLEAAPDVPLFDYGDRWKIFPGVGEPSGGVYDESFLLLASQANTNAPPWAGVDFDDSAWNSGVGPLGFDNSPDYALGTNLSAEMYGIATSLYMRTSFHLDATQFLEIEELELNIDFDDAYALYINGYEWRRDNLGEPFSPTPFDTPADDYHNASNDNGDPIDRSITLWATPELLGLQAGVNVVAVQLHNSGPYSSDMIFQLSLSDATAGSSNVFIAPSQTWRYYIGVDNPSTITKSPEIDGGRSHDFEDWIELYNESPQAVNLLGWSLSDDASDPRKWVFPELVLGPNEFLVALASGESQTNTSAPRLHTNFELSKNGEFLGLFNPSGIKVSSFDGEFPKQNAYHSYGYIESLEAYRFLDTATPEAANGEDGLLAKLKKPVIDHDGGHYDAPIAIAISSEDQNIEIRYTLDGSEPSASSGFLYNGALSSEALKQNASRHGGSFIVLRAAAFRDGHIASDSITRTYLFNQPDPLESLPAVLISGDKRKSLFRPFGSMAQHGHFEDYPHNSFYDIYYTPLGPDEYNLPAIGGRPAERRMSIEFATQDQRGYVQSNIGGRTAASEFSKPRLDLRNAENGFEIYQASKPSFNIFWRDVVEKEDIEFPLFPNSRVTEFDNLRLRAGKNDDINPFIKDELCRRVFMDMGQIGSRGINTALYINGEFQGYYNVVERLRERFFQEWHRDAGPWFVKQAWDIIQGNAATYFSFVDFLNTADFSVRENYEQLLAETDEANVIDYCLINAFTAMWDWPHNNYVTARSASGQGKYRLYMWDAEGGFGIYFLYPVDYNSFTSDLLGGEPPDGNEGPHDGPLLFAAYYQNEEFRIHVMDRVYKHFFNNGALTREHWDARLAELQSEINPIMLYSTGELMRTDWYLTWMNQRYPIFFSQLRSLGLWNDTPPPESDTPMGTLPAGSSIALLNTDGSGTIYFTQDGTDPRGNGGTIDGTIYSGPITIDHSQVIKARLLLNGEWSPLTELSYAINAIPSLELTEVMYNPLDTELADGRDLEFIELHNPSASTVFLSGLFFDRGIDFTFPVDSILEPGSRLILVSDTTAFTHHYPNVEVFGEYEGQLDNGGEMIELKNAAGTTVFAIEYNDGSTWPLTADGEGFSLVPEEASGLDPNEGAYWRASANIGGSPGLPDPNPSISPVYINEVLTHTDLPQLDSIEIVNPNAHEVDISYWLVTDDIDQPIKYPFPAATIIPANGYLVIDESDFGPDTLGASGFRISSVGETIWLLSANQSGALTGYAQELSLRAAANGISFNRFTLSDGKDTWFPSATNTLGSANSDARSPSLIITEIHYVPSAGEPEFIELLNLSGDTLPLYDPSHPENTWKIEGISFSFPLGAELLRGQTGLVVTMDPDEFRSLYAIPTDVAIWGPYAGRLNNGGERLALTMPGESNLDPQTGAPIVPYYLVDAVEYDDSPPWPAAEGHTLARREIPSLGLEPRNWIRSLAMGGTPGSYEAITFDFWSLTQFTEEERANDPKTALLENFDGDSYRNALEYLFDLDGRAPDSGPIFAPFVHAIGDEQFAGLRVRIRERAIDVTLIPQTSTNLADWFDAVDEITSLEAISHDDGTVTRTYLDTIDSSNGNRRYLRLKIVFN